jgi:hypothetical protein
MAARGARGWGVGIIVSRQIIAELAAKRHKRLKREGIDLSFCDSCALLRRFWSFATGSRT